MTRSLLPDPQPGQCLPAISFGPITRTMLALYAGASGDHNPVHIDSDMATASGLPDVFAQGMLSFGVLARVPMQWAGAERLRSIQIRFVSITYLNDMITCAGEVTDVLEIDGKRCARIALTATAQDGRTTLSGEAVVTTT